MLSSQVRRAARLDSSRLTSTLPASSLSAVRHASHSSKNRTLRAQSKARNTPTEYENSLSEHQWKKQVDAMKEYIDASPLKARLGRSLDPFRSSSMWGPLMPSCVSPGLSEPNTQHKSDSYVQTSSFSINVDQHGANKLTRSTYDPVSHRMVPYELLAKQSGFNAQSASASVSAPGNASAPSSPSANGSSEGTVNYSASNAHQAQDTVEKPYDPYSTEPIGLQTAYRKENDDIASGKRPTLAAEMDKAMEPEEYDDGYEKGPIGMQTSYANEFEKGSQSGMSTLEKELFQFERASYESQRGLGPDHVDEYPAHPIGLEMSFRQEASEAEGGMSKLEQELTMKHKSFQEAQRGLGSSHEDEYPDVRQGLQMSYLQEQQGSITLEQELAEKAREAAEAQTGCGSHHHDEFPAAASGIQLSYKAERDDAQSGRRASLEEELRSNKGKPPASSESHTNSKFVQDRPSGGKSSPSPVWAQPARYKMATFDTARCQVMSTESVCPATAVDDSVVSISHAFAVLHQPSCFVSALAESQSQGYQIVHASAKVLIFRQTRDTAIISDLDGTRAQGGDRLWKGVRFAFSVGACTALTVYAVGVFAEKSRSA